MILQRALAWWDRFKQDSEPRDLEKHFKRGGAGDPAGEFWTTDPGESYTGVGRVSGNSAMVDARLYEDWLASGGWNNTEGFGDGASNGDDGGKDGGQRLP